MKLKRKTEIIVLSLFFVSMLILGFALDTGADDIKRPPVLNPRTTPSRTPIATPTRDPRPEKSNQPQQPQQESAKIQTPDIPKDWGEIISSQFLQDGAFLTMTFLDKNGIIRIATFKKNPDSNAVELYNLMIFNRTNKNDLQPVSSKK